MRNLTKFSLFFYDNFMSSVPPPRATRRAPFSVQERSGCQLARHSEQNSFLHVGQHTATPCIIEDTASGVDRHPNFYANANPNPYPDCIKTIYRTQYGKSYFWSFSHSIASLQYFIFLISDKCVQISSILDSILKCSGKKFSFYQLFNLTGIDTDPDLDPSKWCGSDPILF